MAVFQGEEGFEGLEWTAGPIATILYLLVIVSAKQP